jgi:hypothetical protein
MRGAFLLCVLLLCGCKKQTPQAALPQPQLHSTVWDEVLAKPEYSNEVVLAGLNLPTDQWTNITWGPSTKLVRINASKWSRIAAVTDRALAEVEPRLKEMSVSNLVYCFKLVEAPYFDGSQFGEVTGRVFWTGNLLVKRELESRSLYDLQVLRAFRNDKVGFLENPNGMPASLPWQLDEIISDVRDTRTTVPAFTATNR